MFKEWWVDLVCTVAIVWMGLFVLYLFLVGG